MASTVADLGYPMLLIRYRNDAQAPAGNGYAQFGVDEWRDLEGAVQYALDNGAERVVLAGSSMGGSVSLAFLQNSDLADRVVGAFLDAPLTDFAQVVELGAADMGIPGPVAAAWPCGWRSGATASTSTAADYTADAGGFRTPMLIVQGTADTIVARRGQRGVRGGGAARPGHPRALRGCRSPAVLERRSDPLRGPAGRLPGRASPPSHNPSNPPNWGTETAFPAEKVGLAPLLSVSHLT